MHKQCTFVLRLIISHLSFVQTILFHGVAFIVLFHLLNFENISLKHHPSKLNRLSFKRCSENPSHCHFHLMYLATSEFLFKVTSKIYSLKSLKDLKRLSENFYRRSMDLKKLQALSS